MDQHQYFEYKDKGKTILFKETNGEGLICYNCGQKYKKIIVHLSIKEKCRGNINIEQLKEQYNIYRRSKLLQRQREIQRNYINKLKKELGSSTVKKVQNARKALIRRENCWGVVLLRRVKMQEKRKALIRRENC